MNDSEELVQQFARRLLRLRQEQRDLRADVRDVFAEAKAQGLDAVQLRRLVLRMEMSPEVRAESDAILATYEAAVGMAEPAPRASIVAARPDAAALALEYMTAQIVALEDPEAAQALAEDVLFLLDLRAEIAELQAQGRARRAQAKDRGVDAKQLTKAVRWFELVAKHGEEAMRAGEATFNLIRGTVEQHRATEGASERDRALLDKFVPDRAKKPDRRRGAALAALAWIDAAREAGSE